MSMEPVFLHPLRPGESAPARDLVLRILNEEYRMGLTLDELPDLADIHATYRRGDAGNFWVAVVADAVVGCIGVLPLAGTDFELRRMYVDPACRGRGIAQRLLDVALAWCRERGVGDLYLETNAQWKTAHHIYEKTGFVPVAREALPAGFPIVRVATGFYRRRMRDAGPPR